MLENKQSKIIISLAFVISLIFTPMNFDALIIPKIWLTVIIGLYLVPILIINFKSFYAIRHFKIATILTILFVLQMIIVMINSTAPFEQEFFGRTGRGLGFLLYFSSLMVFLVMSTYSNHNTLRFLIKFLALSGVFSSSYAIIQRFNLDVFNWDSRTNGVIGTLGNPNFQSSFTAMALLPIIAFGFALKRGYIWLIICLPIIFTSIYFTQSTQGYVAIGVSLIVLLLYFIWFKSRNWFYISSIFSFCLGVLSVAGMVNKGPLSYWFYKVSVQSRGDFWRSAITAIKENLIFGTGLDSFGDVFLIYRDRISIEMTDNAHNYFLELAATGGLPLMIMYLSITLFVFINFVLVQKKISKFDFKFVSVFCAWLIFQLQSIISPGSIPLIFWNFVISGFVVGYFNYLNNDKSDFERKLISIDRWLPSNSSILFALIGFLIVFPLFKSDILLKQGIRERNANIIMKALISYPESSTKYNVFVQELFKSNLLPQALEIGRAAASFNPNAVSAWAIIFVNPQAPMEERLEAKKQILRLDPLNTEVLSYKM